MSTKQYFVFYFDQIKIADVLLYIPVYCRNLLPENFRFHELMTIWNYIQQGILCA